MKRVDGHLDELELADALTKPQQLHVAGCPDCAARRNVILAVRGAVSGLPRSAEPPAAALALVAKTAAMPRQRSRWKRRARDLVRPLALGAAAALLVLLLGPRALRPGPMDGALAQEIALDHLHYENDAGSAEVSGSAEQIDEFFARTLQRRPHLAAPEAAKLIGGKRCRIGGEWSALIWLERAGHWLSLFSMPQEAVVRRGCARASGVTVCGVPDPRGGSRVLAGRLPNQEMLRLLDESTE